MAGYIKYRPPVPLYVYVIIATIIIILIVIILGMIGLVDLTVISDTIIAWTMAPVSWAGSGIVQTIAFYVGGVAIVFFVAFLFAKRRYITGAKVNLTTAYQPQQGLSTPTMYKEPAPVPVASPQPKPEENKT
jgi:hypothetical protein